MSPASPKCLDLVSPMPNIKNMIRTYAEKSLEPWAGNSPQSVLLENT
jgi:hypothetical protein